jgi:hypothetical protein
VDIISFSLEFSFEFIWIFQNINNKRFELENDTLNQAELNEIKINENN